MFKNLDLPAERRLRHVHALCGAAEMSLFRHRYEATQQADIKHEAESPKLPNARVGNGCNC